MSRRCSTCSDWPTWPAGPVDTLDLGHARLVELGRAMMGTPRLLMLDEPSSGLDADDTDRLAQILGRDPADHRGGRGAGRARPAPGGVGRRPAVRPQLRQGAGHRAGWTRCWPTPTSVGPTSGARRERGPGRTPARRRRPARAAPPTRPRPRGGRCWNWRASVPPTGPTRPSSTCRSRVRAGRAAGPGRGQRGRASRPWPGWCRVWCPPPGARSASTAVDITGRPAYEIARSGLSQLTEGRSVFASLTVEENLTLSFRRALGRRGVPGGLDQAYEAFPRLGERRTQSAGTLSGGEQRMLALARVLVLHQKLLVVDELSFGLAPVVVDEVYAALEPGAGGRDVAAAHRAARGPGAGCWPTTWSCSARAGWSTTDRWPGSRAAWATSCSAAPDRAEPEPGRSPVARPGRGRCRR